MGGGEATWDGDGSARAAAAEIYVRCFPLFLTAAVRKAHPIERSHFHLVTPAGATLAPGLFEDDPRVVVSSAWLDLSSGPVFIHIPNTQGRHFGLSVIDTAGRSVVSLGSWTGDDQGLDLAIVAPRWTGEIRRGVRAVRSMSDNCWAVSRIHAHSMLDRAETVALTERQGLTAENHPPAAAREYAQTMLDPTPQTTLQQVLEIAPDQYVQLLTKVLERAPTALYRSDWEAISSLRPRIGEAASSEELALGFADAIAAIQTAARGLHVAQRFGWRTLAAPHEAETPLSRAARAYESLGAPCREERIMMICDQDHTGRLLSGRNAYRIRLQQGAMPPVNGFWRLYTRPAAGPQYRTGIGSRNDLLLNPDGSLDLTIQHPLPEVAGIANWLPAPGGEFQLVMTLHSPRPAALEGVWWAPQVERLDPSSREGQGPLQRGGAASRKSFDLQNPTGGKELP